MYFDFKSYWIFFVALTVTRSICLTTDYKYMQLRKNGRETGSQLSNWHLSIFFQNFDDHISELELNDMYGCLMYFKWFTQNIHRMHIWQTTRSELRTSRMEARLVEALIFCFDNAHPEKSWFAVPSCFALPTSFNLGKALAMKIVFKYHQTPNKLVIWTAFF